MPFANDGLSIIILTNTDEANPRVIANALADYYFRKQEYFLKAGFGHQASAIDLSCKNLSFQAACNPVLPFDVKGKIKFNPMRKLSFCITLVCMLGIPVAIPAQQSLPDSTVKNLKAAVAGFKERYHAPAIAVAIVKDQSIIFTDAVGYSDIGNKTPVTVNSKFPILSVTKTFTATMFMQLYQQGKLNLFDDVSKYVPEFSGKAEPFSKKGTSLFQLATHTSGLPRNSPADISFTKQVDLWMLNRASYQAFEPATNAEILHSLQYVRKEYPDYELLSYSDRHYSNLGYSVLGIALERAAGADYASFVSNNICKPLKMGNTGFDNRLPDRNTMAKGYYYDEEKKKFIETPVFKSNAALYAGGMYSTAIDLARYISFQFDESPDAAKILTPGNRAMMQSLRIGWKPAYPYVLHEGAMVGFRSQVILDPELKLGWVILTNGNDFEFSGINNYFHKQLQPLYQKQPVTGLEKYAGTYVLDGGYDSLIISVKDATLYSSYLETAGKISSLTSGGGNRFKGNSRGKFSVGYDFVANEHGGIKFLHLGQLLWVKRD